MALRTRKLGDAFGVEVLGLDLSQELSPDVAAALLTLWHDHLLVLFRQQTLDPVALKRFSRIFGDLDAAPPNEQGNPGASAVAGHPDIAIVSSMVLFMILTIRGVGLDGTRESKRSDATREAEAADDTAPGAASASGTEGGPAADDGPAPLAGTQPAA